MALRVCVRPLLSIRLSLLGELPSVRFFSKHHHLHSSSSSSSSSSGAKVLLHFENQSGLRSSVTAMEGESLLDVVINKNLQIDGFGACEGTLACSTCHLIFEESVHKKFEPMGDEEMDMLDLAYGLTKTSRLGCQVIVEPWMEGMTVRVPQELKDQREIQEAQNKHTR